MLRACFSFFLKAGIDTHNLQLSLSLDELEFIGIEGGDMLQIVDLHMWAYSHYLYGREAWWKE